MGAVRGVAEEVGIVPDHLSKVLPIGSPGGATLSVGNQGFDGINDIKT